MTMRGRYELLKIEKVIAVFDKKSFANYIYFDK